MGRMKEVSLEQELLAGPDGYYEYDDEPASENNLPSRYEDEPWIKVNSPARSEPTGWAGKWLIFLKSSKVDAVWAVMKRETLAARLGTAAKVSTAHSHTEYDPDGSHVICVYTADYRNEDDVRAVRSKLFDLGWHAPLSYKSDHMTLAGHRGSLFRY